MLEKILEKFKIQSLNEMQLESLEAVKKNNDLVILSPTGSGKTLGFLLPILEKLDSRKEGVQALILAPSRELAIQIEQVFKKMGTEHKVNCCYGGHLFKIEKNNLKHPPAVLIGTPGRIADHIRRNSFRTDLIHTLVLDEFDKSLEFGFENDMSFIIRELPSLKQRLLTSATEMEEIPFFTGIKNPVTLNYLVDVPLTKLTLKLVKAKEKDKLEVGFNLICHLGNKSGLIFCNHRDAVDRISDLLLNKGLAHGIFHGGMEQEDRERSLIKFRNGSYRMLIATDLAARGLDIPEMDYVIHYQLPLTESAYVHRNGRTARMNASGTAYLVLASDEEVPEYIKEKPEQEKLPEKVTIPEKPNWVTLYLGAGKKDKINKVDIVGLLLQKGKLSKDELGIIEVLDYSSYAAVKADKARSVLHLLKEEKIKNKKVKIELSK